MFEDLSGGLASFSIDLPSSDQHRQLAASRTVARLAELLAAHGFPATWSAADPAGSPFIETVRKRGGRHEFALLGDATWVGRAAGRTRFAHELTTRINAANHRGLPIATLALRGTELDGNLDLLVKHHISAVRSGGGGSRHPGGLLQPHSLRFGVWHVGVSMVVPGSGRWYAPPFFAAKRAIRRAVQERQLVHFLFDSAAIAADEAAGLKLVERLLTFAQSQREHGRLEVKTLAEIAGRLLHTHRIPAARSILRVA